MVVLPMHDSASNTVSSTQSLNQEYTLKPFQGVKFLIFWGDIIPKDQPIAVSMYVHNTLCSARSVALHYCTVEL